MSVCSCPCGAVSHSKPSQSDSSIVTQQPETAFCKKDGEWHVVRNHGALCGTKNSWEDGPAFSLMELTGETFCYECAHSAGMLNPQVTVKLSPTPSDS